MKTVRLADSWTSGKGSSYHQKNFSSWTEIYSDRNKTGRWLCDRRKHHVYRLKILQNTQKIEMKDDVTKVKIPKQIFPLKNCQEQKLTILDKDGKTVESWTSEEKPHYIEMLPIGGAYAK